MVIRSRFCLLLAEIFARFWLQKTAMFFIGRLAVEIAMPNQRNYKD
jgi:hypothetical protein